MKVAIAVASLFTVIAPAAHAAYDRYGNYYDSNDRNYYDSRDRDYRDSARVIESRPVYASGDRQECFNTRTQRYEERPDVKNRVGAGTAIGAVAGGVIGHQVGSGRGNDAATIGGALLGGLIGNRVENDRRDDRATEDFDMNNCRTVALNGTGLQGYDVRYSYNGREYTQRMRSDPGRTLMPGRDIREDGTPYDYVPGAPTAYDPNPPAYYPSGGG
jgi:uncharacterized protein YcfJ